LSRREKSPPRGKIRNEHEKKNKERNNKHGEGARKPISAMVNLC